MANYAITNVARRVVYTGSAGVGPYAFSFPVLVNTDIAVFKNTTLLTLTTDYTVTISGTTGQGSVTLVVAATGADRITIVGARAIERSTDFVTGGDFFANTLNTELDSEVIFVQQIAETAERSLKAPVTDPTSIDMTLPVNTTRANKFLSFNSTGNPQALDAIGTYKGNWSAGVAYVLQDVVKDTSTNNIFIAITAHTSSGSQPITTNVDSAKWSLVVDAASATTSATNAATSATNAAASASAASSSASGANTSATNAGISAAASAASASTSTAQAVLAAASAAAAAASADNFDDTYLGAFSSNPTLDNDGNSLTTGDLYFNTVANELRVYNGTAWQAAALTAASFLTVANNLSDLANNGTARTNLGLGTLATVSPTGTANATTFLRGDNAYAVVSVTPTAVSDQTNSSTGFFDLPAGTTGQRPGSPTSGNIRYNTSTNGFEGYTTAWGSIGGGASAGGVIWENSLSVSSNYTLTASKNGLSVGPITIDSGVSVTVGSGQRWVIL